MQYEKKKETFLLFILTSVFVTKYIFSCELAKSKCNNTVLKFV